MGIMDIRNPWEVIEETKFLLEGEYELTMDSISIEEMFVEETSIWK